jgi:DNA polymerase-3 subunit chi
MTRIDFYQIDSQEAALVFTCRLVDKIYHRGHQIHIHTVDARQSEELDELLWGFRADSFLPHSQCLTATASTTEAPDDNQSAPIRISHVAEPDHQDILINISGAVPDFFSRFDRVAEVVPLDQASRKAARANYSFYQDRGYPLHYHDMKRKK